MATIDAAEAGFFGALAGDWWDPRGSSAMLHRINPLRLRYIRDAVAVDPRSRTPLTGRTALDVGCGAGLLTEPLARLGAAVTGIDAARENIAAAAAHAAAGGLNISYRSVAVEELAAEGRTFDLVTCMEVVEHVADRPAFLRSLRTLTAPGGTLVMSTPNRTPLSYAALIVGAERIMRSIPRGAHDWHKFVTPEEVDRRAGGGGLRCHRYDRPDMAAGDGVRPRPRHVGQLLPDGSSRLTTTCGGGANGGGGDGDAGAPKRRPHCRARRW